MLETEQRGGGGTTMIANIARKKNLPAHGIGPGYLQNHLFIGSLSGPHISTGFLSERKPAYETFEVYLFGSSPLLFGVICPPNIQLGNLFPFY